MVTGRGDARPPTASRSHRVERHAGLRPWGDVLLHTTFLHELTGKKMGEPCLSMY